jgi:hypothetical protein
MQLLSVSSYRISMGTGTVLGSGGSRSGSWRNPVGAQAKEETPSQASHLGLLTLNKWLTAMQ